MLTAVSEAQPSLPRARGELRIGFKRSDGGTRLAELYQSGCARALLPRVDPAAPPEAVLINTAGGLTDGDRLHYTVRLEEGASAVVASQAAERIYRSRGGDSTIDTRLEVGSDGWLEWLPQETILFDASRLRRHTAADLAPGARLLACEALVFGRVASGETLHSCFLHDAWRIRRGGRLVWADGLRLDGAVQDLLAQPAVTGGARAAATLIYAAPDSGDRLATLRDALGGSGGRAAACLVNGLLLARLIAPDAMTLRGDLAAAVTALRAAGAGLPPSMPAVWRC